MKTMRMEAGFTVKAGFLRTEARSRDAAPGSQAWPSKASKLPQESVWERFRGAACRDSALNPLSDPSAQPPNSKALQQDRGQQGCLL